MSDFDRLDIYLHDSLVAQVINLPGDKNLFTFHESYLSDLNRPTLSLSFRDITGDLIANVKETRTRLPPFLSNLLPEGPMRDYLARQAGVSSEREFYLLKALGQDLPGALKALSPKSKENVLQNLEEKQTRQSETDHSILHFSLAGVQLKFSAILEQEGGLTIPANGAGGKWIVKLPSVSYPDVPENEFVMMELARAIGIDIPETALLPIDQIEGLPQEIKTMSGNKAFVIKRFDRSDSGDIHIEDFAQVFSVFPESKYKHASYRNVVEVIWAEAGELGVIEFIRRFVFNALIGNGDMHLKNWSLIYKDQRKASLSPAYDFVSTIPYLPQDRLALTFVDSKDFNSLTIEQFKRFAAKAKLPEALVLETLFQTVKDFKTAWKKIESYPLNPKFQSIIQNHFQTLPFYQA